MKNTETLEPKASAIIEGLPDYRSNLIRSINWYSLEKEKKDARTYLKQYIKTINPTLYKTFDKVSDSKIVTSYGWVSRLANQGAKLDVTTLDKLNKYITELIPEPVKVKEVVETTPRKSVRDYVEEKAFEYIGELEGVLDEADPSFSLLNDLKGKSIPQPYVPLIESWSKKKLTEFLDVYESKELLEGYGWSKSKAKLMAKLVASMIEDLEKYSSFRKANRKPRAKKSRPAASQIKTLKYKSKDEELNIQSVSPLEIVGASQVWLYNTKTKKLSVYKTESSTGIQVKGTTLQNYEPELSSTKTLRKPVETLAALSKAGKVQLRKFIDELSTKPQEVNGRVNTDMLIIRTVK